MSGITRVSGLAVVFFVTLLIAGSAFAEVGDSRVARQGDDRSITNRAAADATPARPVLTPKEIEQLLADIRSRDKGSVLIVECNGAYGYATIQSAIDAAVDGDVIVVLPNTCNAEGRYYERINFLGKAITVQSVYPTDSDIVAATIIDGDAKGTVVTFNNHEGADSVLDGLTITNGDASYGGGINCSRSTVPTLIRCNIRGNTGGFGGGVFFGNGTLINCTIRDNDATYGGGVCCSDYARPGITGCTIEYNAATLYGGGVQCRYYSDPVLTDCVIRGNQAGLGGGVHSEYWAKPSLSNCAIIQNTASATTTDYGGGGVYSSGSEITLTNCAIRDNVTAARGGGVFCKVPGKLTNCEITGNRASSGGGVATASSSRSVLTNCIISGNAAIREGGGVYCGYNPTGLTNCTIIANTAPIGGGLYSIGSSIPKLTNCILWGNSSQEISYKQPNSPNVTYCDVQGGWTGTGNIDLDPQFAFPDDFHLASDSPCIDTGAITPPYDLPAEDFDGNPRTIDGNGDSQAVADMGAYEFNPAAASIAVSSTRIVFFFAEGQGGSAQQEIMIRNAGGGTLQWSLNWDAAWLQADVTQGQSTGEADSVVLTANASTLPHGSYTTQLTISDPSATNAPRMVEVVLNVNITAEVPGAYPTIQAAIDAATVPGDEVVVADGTYTGAGNKNLDFDGKAITVRSVSGDPAQCVIDCENDGRGFYFHTNEPPMAQVEGFTIQNGYEKLGGGIYCFLSSPTLTNLILSDNTAYQDGGGIYCSCAATPDIVNSIFGGNTAFKDGGALWCAYAQPFLTNCIIAENSASDAGGGLYCSVSGDVVLTNCTIGANSAFDGGGLFCGGPSNPTLSNCILWGDVPQEISLVAATPMLAYCDVQGGWEGEGNIDIDPVFAFPDDFHLMNGSPCIDTGTNTPSSGLSSEDVDGNPRPLDGDGDSQAVADMGAYEFNPAAVSIAVSPTRVVFFVAEDSSASLEFMIRNAGGGTLQWTLDSNAAWLHADVTQGESAGEVDSVILTADASTLVHGSYATLLTISDPSATIAPRIVEVVLNVNIAANVPGTYPTIQAAIDAATVPGDEVVVADGKYTGAGNRNLDFGGRAITVRSASGDPAQCVIDCENSGRGFIFQSGERSTSVVEGFTIKNGLQTEGGGVYCKGSSPTLTTCEISGNSSTSDDVIAGGGGVCCEYASPTLGDCTISGNSAVSSGGGIACMWNSSPTLRNCTISGNGNPYVGGGLFSYDSYPVVINCTISENTASLEGAGVVCRHSSATMVNTVISSNTAAYAAGGIICWEGARLLMSGCAIEGNVAPAGGGILCAENGIATLVDCTIVHNFAPLTPDPGCPGPAGGGGVYCETWGDLSLANCTISGNTAYGDGGGIYCEDASMTLVSCKITGNRSFAYGGGIYADFLDSPVITNCTFNGNTCSGKGGGAYFRGGEADAVINSIFWGNQPQEISLEIYTTASLNHCNIQGGWTGIGNIDADPLFVDPDGADDVPGTDDDDFRLMPNSPCIDAGDPDFVAAPGETDLDGRPRVMGCGVDIGAYEFIAGAPGSGDLDGSGVLDSDDVAIFVAELLAGSGPTALCVADLNADDRIDGLDIQLFTALLLGQ